MKKLSNKQISERQKLCQRLRNAASFMEEKIARYNTSSALWKDEIKAAVNDYNAVIQDAKEFSEGIAADAQTYMEDQSERWAESDAGKEHIAWQDEWETAELEEIEVEIPDELDLPAVDAADTLEQLAEEAFS